MAGNQKATPVVLPPCRILLDEVDSAGFEVHKLTAFPLRMTGSRIVPLRLRPDGHPPYTRVDDACSIPDLDSYHADDETSDSEDTSLYGFTDDESDSSWLSSGDDPQIPSEVFAKNVPSICKRQQIEHTPAVRLSVKSILSSYAQDRDISYPQSPVELSSIEAYFSPWSRRPHSEAPPLQKSPVDLSSSSQDDTDSSSHRSTEDMSSVATPSHRMSESQAQSTAGKDMRTSPVDKGKRRATDEELLVQQQDSPTGSKESSLPCDAPDCLKAHFINALFEHSGRLPFPAPSPTPSLESTGNSSHNAPESSTAHTAPDGNSLASHPIIIHRPLELCAPTVTFCVPEGSVKTFGVALSDILQYEGVYMLRASDSMSGIWEDVAPGTGINLAIHWKGHSQEKIYPIVVKCACGFAIRRSQLALALTKAQVSYFATSELDLSYMPPAENVDPFHPSNFIIKAHHNLRLMSLFTPDNGKTWRTNHAIAEDPAHHTGFSQAPEDDEPRPTVNAEALLTILRNKAQQELKAQEALRAQELRAQKKIKAQQEVKASKQDTKSVKNRNSWTRKAKKGCSRGEKL